LSKTDFDEALDSFPPLQVQMNIIAESTEYKNDVFQAHTSHAAYHSLK